MIEPGKKSQVQDLFSKLTNKKILENLSPTNKNRRIWAVGITLIVVVLTVFVLEPKDLESTAPVKPNNTDTSNLTQSKCESLLSGDCAVHLKDEFFKRISNSKLLGQVQNFGVILAAILYFLEKPERQKQAERQAWQLIDGARGAETSGARFQAIQELHEKGVPLKGLDADGADLIGINLQGANLERASFKNALLQGANLEGANLKYAQLQKAKLQGANLKGAHFEGANLEGAELDELEPVSQNELDDQPKYEKRSTDLEGADLYRANLQGAFLNGAKLKNAKFSKAILSGADFYGADLQGAKFKNARLNGTRFGKTKNLTLDQVELVKYGEDDKYDWKDALYDKSFCDEHPQMNLCPDQLDELIEKIDVDKNRKIVSQEILHNIAELLKVMESNNSVFLQDNLIVKDLKAALESLIENEKSHEELCTRRAAKIKRLTTDFDETLDQRDKIYKNTEEVNSGIENAASRMEDLEKRFHLASQWLESNREIILNSKEVGNYLDRYSATTITGGVINSSEQLKTDIDKCMKKICASLDTAKNPDYETTDLRVSSPILAEGLKVVEKVTLEVIKQSNNPPDDIEANIKHFFKTLIDQLQ